jgi:hypothetical protein
VNGDDIVLALPQIQMTKHQAMVHAAWLIALADRSDNFEEFRGILKAVLET